MKENDLKKERKKWVSGFSLSASMLYGKELSLRINGKEAELLETIPNEFIV